MAGVGFNSSFPWLECSVLYSSTTTLLEQMSLELSFIMSRRRTQVLNKPFALLVLSSVLAGTKRLVSGVQEQTMAAAYLSVRSNSTFSLSLSLSLCDSGYIAHCAQFLQPGGRPGSHGMPSWVLAKADGLKWHLWWLAPWDPSRS